MVRNFVYVVLNDPDEQLNYHSIQIAINVVSGEYVVDSFCSTRRWSSEFALFRNFYEDSLEAR